MRLHLLSMCHATKGENNIDISIRERKKDEQQCLPISPTRYPTYETYSYEIIVRG